jgi:uncharacterized protein (TIGR00369 family)
MEKLPSTKSCFVCGTRNPIGLKLCFETDGTIVQTRFLPQPVHVGFQGVVHGGIISTLLDEIMVWACCVQTRRFSYCAELNVRFAHPAKPGEEIVATAQLTSARRNKLFEARGELRNPQGILLAAATGKYLAIKEEETREMLSDLEGNLDDIFSRLPKPAGPD